MADMDEGGRTMQDDLKSLFAYNRWANRRVVEACRALAPAQYEQEPLPGWPSIRSTLVLTGGSCRNASTSPAITIAETAASNASSVAAAAAATVG